MTIQQLDRRFVAAEPSDVFGKTYLRAGDGKGDDAESIDPVPDADRCRLQIDFFIFACCKFYRITDQI